MHVMSRSWLGVAVIAAMGLALAVVFGPQTAFADDGAPGVRPLTPEWAELLARKEQARRSDPRAIGTSNVRAPNPAGASTVTRTMTRGVRTSKAEMRQRLAQQRATIDQALSTGAVSPAVASGLAAELDSDAARIESFPDGWFTMSVPAMEAGSHSITMSQYAYTSCCASDPMSFVWYNVGSSWDVNWDLQNLPIPSRRWTGEGVCENDLFGYTWDAVHGGTDGWEKQDYGLMYQYGGVCVNARYHTRLFDRGFTDTHGTYGRWSFGEPHHDRFGDHCVDDWDGAQEVMHQAWLDANGQPLLVVGAIYQVNWGNGGTFGCATADSYGWYVNLVY